MLYNGPMKQKVPLFFALSILVGLVGAGVTTILPNQYTAKGLLVITRRTDVPAKEVFTYEGYYAQQNATSYTATFLAILQSPSNLISADSTSDPKELLRLIKAKREGSQVIILSAQGQTPQDAQRLWKKVSDSAIQAHIELTASADPLLKITKTPNSPVILRTYPERLSIFGAGFAFSFIIMLSAMASVRYLKEDHDN